MSGDLSSDGMYGWVKPHDLDPTEREYIGIRPDTVINLPRMYTGLPTYIVPPGIGDIAWIYAKLNTMDQDFVLLVPGKTKIKEQAAQSLRSLPFINLLPRVVYSSVAYCEGSHAYIAGHLSNYTNGVFPESPAFLCFNWHLERGNKLENILPGFKTNRHFEMKRPQWAMDEAKLFLSPGEKAIAFYTSSDGYFDGQDFTAIKWAQLIQDTAMKFPKHKIMLIGTTWDMRLMFPLYNTLCGMGLKSRVVMIHDRDIATVLEVLRACDFLVGAVSGLTIIAEYQRVPTVHLYPKFLHSGETLNHESMNLIGTWESPEMVRNRTSLSIPYVDFNSVKRIATDFAPFI